MAFKFVSTSGSNSNSGSQSSPYRDWWKGLANVGPGDTLYIRAGTYDENISLSSLAGTAGARITVSGYADEIPVLSPASSGTVLSLSAIEYITFQQFIVDAIGTLAVAPTEANGIGLFGGGHHCIFQDLEVKRAAYNGIGLDPDEHHHQFINVESHHNALGDILYQGHGIYLAGSDCLVDGGSYHHNQGTNGNSYGIHQYLGTGGSSRNIVRRLLSYANDHGIILSSGDANRGENLVLYENLGYGAQFYNVGTNLKLLNCTIVANGLSAVFCDGFAIAEVINNILWNNGTDDFVVVTGSVTEGANLVGVDPLFVNEAANNYQLQDGSPAKNSGTSLSFYFSTDLYGNTRVDWDMGAIEGEPSDPGDIGDPGDLSPVETPETPTPLLARRDVGDAVVVATLYLDSGAEGFSERFVQRPTFLHEGRVLKWGIAERSIPVPAGLPRVGDCQIRMADTDRKWRDLLAAQTPRRRLIALDVIRGDFSPQTVFNIGVFEVVDAVFPQDEVQIIGRDITFAWMDKPIVPNLINRRNFPELPIGIDEAFMPILVGVNRSPADNPQGVVALPHMGLFVSTISPVESPSILVDRWGLAAHPISTFDPPIVYRKLATGGLFSTVPDGVFSVVDPSEYYIIQDGPRIIDGIEYNMMFVDFHVEQDPGTEIRVDCDGFDFRGSWGDENPPVTSTTGPLRNPIDFLINLLYVILADEVQIPRINTASFATARTIMAGENPSHIVFPYLCDGAIVEQLTARAALSQLVTSFEFDLYVNREGEIEVNVTIGEDPDRPVFDDTFDFLKGSVTSRLPNPTFNRWRYLYDKNFATGEYAAEGVYNNEADQIALALPTSPIVPQIEEEIVEMPFVRDDDTASQVIGRRSQFLALGSYRIEVKLPTPQVFLDLELAQLFGVTHYGGLDVDGWTNAEFKTTDIVHDLDARETTVRAVLRVPQTVDQNPEVPVEVPPQTCGLLTGRWTHNSRVGPHSGLRDQDIYGVFLNETADDTIDIQKSDDWGETWSIIQSFTTTDDVLSHDSEVDVVNGRIKIWHQEQGGRVGYSVLDMLTDTLTTADQEVVASANMGIGIVSGCTRSTGETVVMYDTDVENVGGSDRERIGVRIETSPGVWSAEFQVGDWGIAQGNVLSRAIAGLSGRLKFLFNEVPGVSVLSTADLAYQEMADDNSLGSVTLWLITGLLSTTPTCFAGDPTTWIDSGAMLIAIPFSRGGEAYLAVFDEETMTLILSSPDCIPGCPAIVESSSIAICSQVVVRVQNGRMHAFGFRRSLTESTWIWHKAGEPIVGIIPADPDANQIGPITGSSPSVNQEMGASVQTDDDLLDYGLVFMKSGLGVLFNRIRTDLLPSSPDLTISEWALSCIHEGDALAVQSSANFHRVDIPSLVLGAQSTLFGWYYLTGVAISNYNPIWGGGDGATDLQVYYGSGVVAGKLEIVIALTPIFRSSEDVVADAWKHLVIIDTGSAIQVFYNNVGLTNVIGGYTTMAGQAIVRTNQGVNGNNFRGIIDEVGIFSRALSSTERAILYNNGAGVRGDTDQAPFSTGLELGYHFDETVGTIALDYSGNERSGTLIAGIARVAGYVPV